MDPRRTRRLSKIGGRLARNPQRSFPEAMGSESELEGAYRFMNNHHVTFEAIHAPHARSTARRAKHASSVLVVHDTTTCIFPQADPAVIGYLPTGKAGFFVHYSLVLDEASGEPLGIAHVETLFRSKRCGRKSKQKEPGSKTVRKHNRESLRWQRGLVECAVLLSACDVIHVGDRESDSYPLLHGCLERGDRFVFRVRVPNRKAQTVGGESGFVAEFAAKIEGVLERDIAISRRRKLSAPRGSKTHAARAARLATLNFSATRLDLVRPRYYGKNEFPKRLRVNVVRVWEPQAPAGEEPIEWLLYTSEPVETPKQIARVVDIYRRRWVIEECNKALKTGCLYEERQFESREALLTLLAISLPVACEILKLRTVARLQPDTPASSVVNATQLQILRKLGSRKLPSTPTARDVLLAVAAMGGHQRANGPPGWLILQRGMTRLLTLEEGWRAARGEESDL